MAREEKVAHNNRTEDEGKGPALLVLAAGIGSRYGGLKQMDPVGPNGEMLFEYSVYDALQAGFNRLTFVIRREMEEEFRKSLGRRFEKQASVKYVFQELDKIPPVFPVPRTRKKPWGTGHAVLVAEEAIREPFAVINSDDFYGRGSFHAQGEFLTGRSDDGVPCYSLVGYVLRNTLSGHGSVSRAICQCDERGYLQGIVERTRIEKDDEQARYMDEQGRWQPLTGDEVASMNMWGFTPSIFAHLRQGIQEFLKDHGREAKSEFFLPAVAGELVAQGSAQVKVLPCTSSWFGMTYPEDRARVRAEIRALVARGDYPEQLWR